MLIDEQLVDISLSPHETCRKRLQTLLRQHPFSVIGEIAHVIELIEELLGVSAALAFIAQDGWLEGGLDPDRA